MRVLVRTWVGFAALGAGLIHLAVAATAPLPALLALGLLGAGELVWAVLALAGDRAPAPRTGLVGALAGVAAEVALLIAGAGSGPVVPVASLTGASLLDLAVAATLAVGLRGGSRSIAAVPPVWGYLAGTVAGAAAVAAITSVSLGSTAIGVTTMQPMHM